MPDKFEIVDADLGADVERDIETYLCEQITLLERAHKELHESKIPKWRRMYQGTPAEPNKSFPWPNASNVVVQVIGQTVDTAAARVLGLLYATHPLWVFQNFQKYEDEKEIRQAETRRRAIEDFMDLLGIEPDQLDLYRIEGQWFTDTARLGTGFVKASPEELVERMVVGYTEQKKIRGKELEKYNMRVSRIRHENLLADPTYDTLDDCPLVVHKRPLKIMDLEDRAFSGFYDKKAVDKIKNSPDGSSPEYPQQQETQDQGVQMAGANRYTAEWRVYECYFYWWFKGNKYRLIWSYHKGTKTTLRKVFNFMPRNALPIVRSKLGYRTDGLYGHGYGELLEYYQEELSAIHNQRIDNATIANIRALRVSPRARNLDANFELYPGALLVGEKDEFEAIQVGDVYPSSFKNEEMTLGLVQQRSGISPAQSGLGTGGMTKRPVMYSSGATLAVMQENNSRIGHATSEFRHAHVMLGSLLTSMYGKFGVRDKAQMFGIDADALKAALKEFEGNSLRIPIRAATGSLNREIQKQNDMIMAGVIQRHYTAIGQLLQSIENPMIPADAKDYFTRVAQASNMLMRRILKDFDYDQPDQYVPEPKIAKNQAGPQAQQPPQAGGGAPVPGAAGGGGGGPMVPAGPGEGVSAGPPGSPIPGAR